MKTENWREGGRVWTRAALRAGVKSQGSALATRFTLNLRNILVPDIQALFPTLLEGMVPWMP
jgi:hypothetical protein